MSTFENGIQTKAPYVDKRLHEKIIFAASCIIPDVIIAAMTDVIKAVSDQMEKENKTFGERTEIFCIFTENPQFTISLDNNEVAICMKLAVYPVNNLLKYAGDKRLYAILAEELCHLIWEISDETLVCYKVIDVLKNIFPGIEVSDVYKI